MGCTKDYFCDTCKKPMDIRELIGYRIEADELAPDDHGANNHICYKCLSSFQSFVRVCGAGFEHSAGPHCNSDHK